MRVTALFLWIVFPLAVFAAYAVFGLPHMIWSYSFHDIGSRDGLSVERHYVSCTFVGPYGEFAVPAQSGHCGWVRFFKPTSSQ